MILSVLLIRSETLQAEIGVNIKFSIIFRLAKPALFRYIEFSVYICIGVDIVYAQRGPIYIAEA